MDSLDVEAKHLRLLGKLIKYWEYLLRLTVQRSSEYCIYYIFFGMKEIPSGAKDLYQRSAIALSYLELESPLYSVTSQVNCPGPIATLPIVKLRVVTM